ncbi:MAG TPA: hypothetical protein VGW12_13915 [Pyrinomonadaceae bacterium]|nr:hypothetical protein [Pyrinomonadaceae bacterium]
MTVVIDQVNLDVAEPPPKKRGSGGGGDDSSGGGGGGEAPKPEEFERMWKQQAERAERVRAH